MNTSVRFGKCAIMLTLAMAVAGLFATSASAQHTTGRAQIQAQEHQLVKFTKAHNAKLSPIDLAVHETLSAAPATSTAHRNTHLGMTVASHVCTATATLTTAKHNAMKFAATAPTCGRAIGMVANGVKAYLLALRAVPPL